MLNKMANIHEAKTHLSQLLQFVTAGNQVTICKAGQPLAKLVPITAVKAQKRKSGTLKGQIKMADDFDEMPDWFMEHFAPTSKKSKKNVIKSK
jgi:prevent-host-death family protein